MSRKRVQRLMRKTGIQSIAPKPDTSLPRKALKQYFDFYNFERTHQSFADQIPIEVYRGKDLALMAA